MDWSRFRRRVTMDWSRYRGRVTMDWSRYRGGISGLVLVSREYQWTGLGIEGVYK